MSALDELQAAGLEQAEVDQLCVDTIRMLSMDGVEQASSGST